MAKIYEESFLNTSSNNLKPTLEVTEAAAKKVYQLIQEEGNDKLNLRVYIVGGGCSGFQYGFSFDEQQDDDVILEKSVQILANATEVVKIVVDSLSILYLNGAQVDYVESLQGSHFVVHNPNAKTTCGCGASFSV